MYRGLENKMMWGTLFVIIFLLIPFLVPYPTYDEGDDMDDYFTKVKWHGYVMLFSYFMVFITILAMIWTVALNVPGPITRKRWDDTAQTLQDKIDADKEAALDPEEVYRLRDGGASMSEIALICHVKMSAIERILAQQSIDTIPDNLKEPTSNKELDRAEIRKFRDMGWDSKRIAEFYGVDAKTLLEFLKE